MLGLGAGEVRLLFTTHTAQGLTSGHGLALLLLISQLREITFTENCLLENPEKHTAICPKPALEIKYTRKSLAEPHAEKSEFDYSNNSNKMPICY